MSRVRTLVIIISLLIIIFYPASAWSAFKTKISSSQIQNAMVQHFPLREYTAFARLTLNIPDVMLSKDSKVIVLMIPVDADFTGEPLKQGHAQIDVLINYNPSTGGLHFTNPRLNKFEMPGITKNMHNDVKLTLDNLLKSALPLIQIYQVNESDLNHSLNKSVLKHFLIGDDFIRVEFGFE